MGYPGISASPQDLERWLDATVARRINCGRIDGRWMVVKAASPHGIALYECSNCGRLTMAPEKRCYPLVGDKGKWR